MMKQGETGDFYVVARERGAEHPAIPTWANNTPNPAALKADPQQKIERVQIDGVPGTFQLLNVLTPAECQRFIQLTEHLGYLQDAAVSLPRSVRHNDSLTWVVDDLSNALIWQRCERVINQHIDGVHSSLAVGLNGRFRFYRYQHRDYFAPHTDGAWPGSRVIDGVLQANAYADRFSELTFLLFLSDGYGGGRTQFFVDRNSGKPTHKTQNAETIAVRTPLGGVLCFPHGSHPLHCLHASEPISSGSKYIMRSDVLFLI